MAKKTKEEMAAERLAYQDSDLSSIETVPLEGLTDEEKKSNQETE